MNRDDTPAALAEADLEQITAGKRHRKAPGCRCGPSCRCGLSAPAIAPATMMPAPAAAPELGACPGGRCKKG